MTVRDRHFQGELHWITRALAGARGGATDPDLDLLVEACAFLTGRVHARIDDATAGLYQQIANLTRPQLTRLVPPAVIVELSPRPGARHVRLPAGCELDAPTTVGEPCRFRTSHDLAVLPLRVSAVDATDGHGDPTLHIQLTATAAGGLALLADAGLRLFIAADPPLGPQLALWALHHCTSANLVVAGRTVQQLAPPTLAAAPASSDDAAPGTQLLQSAWALPQRLLFFELTGFVRANLTSADTCTLVLHCPDAPELPFRTCPEDLKVGCVPAVNLFEADAVPIRADLVTAVHALRVDGIRPRHAEIHDVLSVTGIPTGRGDKRRYVPAATFLGQDGAAGCFSLARARSPDDGALDLELRIDAHDPPPREVLAARLLVSNRDLVADVEPGAPWSLRRGPDSLVARPVSRISPPLRPPLGEGFHARLAAHTALDLTGLLTQDRLRNYLALYNFHPEDSLQGRRCTAQIAAIRSLAVTPSLHVTPHGTIRGAAVAVTLDERSFFNTGEAYLFAHVLRAILADVTPLNTVLEFSAHLTPSDGTLRWPTQLQTRRV